MKLTLTAVAALSVMTLASCGSKSNENSTEVADSVAVEEIVAEGVDSAGQEIVAVEGVEETAATAPEGEGASILDKLKSATSADQVKELAAKAQTYVQQLIASGKVEEAKAYMAQIAPYIKDKAPKAYEALDKVIKSSDKLDGLKDKAADLKSAAAEKAADTKAAVAEKAEAAKSAAAEKASDAANKAKDALKNAF